MVGAIVAEGTIVAVASGAIAIAGVVVAIDEMVATGGAVALTGGVGVCPSAVKARATDQEKLRKLTLIFIGLLVRCGEPGGWIQVVWMAGRKRRVSERVLVDRKPVPSKVAASEFAA